MTACTRHPPQPFLAEKAAAESLLGLAQLVAANVAEYPPDGREQALFGFAERVRCILAARQPKFAETGI